MQCITRFDRIGNKCYQIFRGVMNIDCGGLDILKKEKIIYSQESM